MTHEGLDNGTGQGLGQGAPADLGAVNTSMIPNFAVPNPEADWLFHNG